jgi:hypothetical protein
MIDWLLRNSLFFATIGLCIASSGLDGTYMAAWMPPGLGWLGYVLNTVADLTGMIIFYQYSRLQQTRRNEAGGKRRLQLSRVLLGAEVITVGYSWFLSWRQLRIVLPAIEPQAWHWVAPAAAGFVPLLLAFVGFTQGLLAGRIESEAATQTQTAAMQETQSLVTVAAGDNGDLHLCPFCGAGAGKTGKPFANAQAVSAHLRGCEVYQAQKAQIGAIA